MAEENRTASLETITADCVVEDVVVRFPQTISVFARHGLHCVGCYISPFHTIADSAYAYAVAIDPLLTDLNRTIAAGKI